MIDNDETATNKKSKSQRKREMHALQDLGEELVALNKEQMLKVPLSEELREAVIAAQKIKAHGARRRQIQYIGRLIRDVDPAPIQQALDILKNKNNCAAAQFHQVEKWREKIIEGDVLAIDGVLEAFPQTDRQHLMQLARNVQREQEEGKPPKAARELFRYLKELQEEVQKTEYSNQETE